MDPLDIEVSFKVYDVLMDVGYRIAEVASRSGTTPATLRYYERVGVLPEPRRTNNGYRVYDGRTIERLAFVSRAKQLGCTLEEIAELCVAWEGGECGPVQVRLRQLLADKRTAAQAEMAALARFSSDLDDAAVALARHRPTGPCDERCGCTGSVGHGDDVAIGCTLDAAALGDRVAEWLALVGEPGSPSAAARVTIPGGVRVQFDDVDLAELTRLMQAEQACCGFMSFALTIDRRGVGLEVTASGEGEPVVRALFALAC